MILKIRIYLFYTFFTLLLLTSAWGIPNGRMLALHLICVMPFLLFSTYIFNKEKLHIPQLITLGFMLFSIVVSLSTFTASNIQNAFEYQLYYVSVFLLFLYVYNEQSSIKKHFLQFIKIASIATICYSIFLHFLLPEKLISLLPTNSSQLVYKFEGYLNHHPLGAFLLVPLSILFIYVFYKQKAELIISLIIGFGLLILSNLRAAYIGFITIVFITFHFEWRNGFNRTLKTLGIFVISIIIIALLINSRIGIKIPIFTDINNLLIKNKIMAVYRPFFNTRDEYIIQSIRAIQDRPILGFGANNFYYASMLHTPTIAGLTTNAHNLFLTIAVENGLPGLVIFLCIIYLLLRTVPEIYKERSILEKCIIAIFISLLVLFQFNFYSRIYFLFTMLFVCAGLIYKEKERITDSYVVFFLSGLIAILSLVVFFAKIVYLQGNPLLALQMYPIYADAYKEQIRKEYEIGNTSQVKQYLNRYSSLFYNEPQQLKVIANIYYDLNDYKNALIMYKQGLKLFPVETSFIMAVYSTYDKSGNPKEGESYIRNHIKKYDILKSKNSSKDNTFMKNWFKERGIKL